MKTFISKYMNRFNKHQAVFSLAYIMQAGRGTHLCRVTELATGRCCVMGFPGRSIRLDGLSGLRRRFAWTMEQLAREGLAPYVDALAERDA